MGNTMTWLDMVTAPKDGRRILVADGRTVRMVYWLKASGFPTGWQDVEAEYQSYVRPSHWMPLPNPPVRSARETRSRSHDDE